MLSPPPSSQSPEDCRVKSQFSHVSSAFVHSPNAETACDLLAQLKVTSTDAIFSSNEILEAASQLLHTSYGLQLYLVALDKWPEHAASAAPRVLSSFAENLSNIDQLNELIPLVRDLACRDEVNWKDLSKLCRAALAFLVSDGDAAIKNKLLGLLTTVFKIKQESRDHLQSLTLNYLCKPLDYYRDQAISKYSSVKISAVAMLLINYLHIHGSVPLQQLDEAVAYSKRQQYLDLCTAATRASTDFAATVVQLCVDLSSSAFVSNLLDDFFAAIFVPEQCGAEALVRCLCVTVLVQCRNYTRKMSYPPAHLLEILGRSQRCLYHIFKAPPSKGVGTILDYLVSNNSKNAALYLAASQSTLNEASDYQDFYLRFTTPQTRVPSMTAKRWLSILKTEKIGRYYESILESMVVISESGIPGPAYVAILKSLAQAVQEHPACFEKLKGHLLRKLPVASSSVCEWTVQIFSSYFAATQIDSLLLAKVMMRLSSPGNLGYKKRCITLLVQSASLPETSVASWQFLLALCGDAKASIAQSAVSTICQFVNDSAPHQLYLTISQLGAKHAGILTSILRHPAVNKKSVHKFVSFLLASVEETPNYEKLKVASVVIGANGLFLPPSKVPSLVQLSVSKGKTPESRLIILTMLQSALTTKPKIILSPKIVQPIFQKMVQLLPCYTEHELEKAGRIIWELCSLGRSEDKIERKRQVLQVYESAFEALPLATSPTVQTQLMFIVGVGARVWVKSEACVPLLLKLTGGQLRLAAIRVLCRVCTVFPHLFLSGPCHDFFKEYVFSKPQSDEWNQFMAGFLDFLEQQPVAEQSKEMNMEMLHGTEASLVADSTLSGLYQTYFDALSTCALSDSPAAATASRLLLRGILHNKVDSSACSTVITTMCCSSNAEVSQIAQDGFECLAERKQLDGVVQGLVAAQSVTFLVFQRLFEMMHDPSVVFEELVASMFASPRLAASAFNGLCKVELSPAQLQKLEAIVDDRIYTFDGPSEHLSVLIALKASLQYKQVQECACALEPINPMRLLSNDCDELADRLKELSSFEDIFAEIAAASLKRKRSL